MLSSSESHSFLLLDFLYLLSSDESDSLDDESDNDASDFLYVGMCTFPFCFEDSVGPICGVGYDVFFPIGNDSNCDIFSLVVFIPIVVYSKGSRLIEIFWFPKS